VIGYFLLKRKNRKLAEKLLIVGIIFWPIVYLLIIGMSYVYTYITYLTAYKKTQISSMNLISAENTMKILEEKINSVANTGGNYTITVTFPATWVINSSENSISLTFNSKVSNIGLGSWIPLTPNATCPPAPGKLGIDSPSVLCVKADTKNEYFEINYKLWFRELDGYKIQLESIGKAKSSNVRFISIERISSGKITKVGISLIE